MNFTSTMFSPFGLAVRGALLNRAGQLHSPMGEQVTPSSPLHFVFAFEFFFPVEISSSLNYVYCRVNPEALLLNKVMIKK